MPHPPTPVCRAQPVHCIVLLVLAASIVLVPDTASAQEERLIHPAAPPAAVATGTATSITETSVILEASGGGGSTTKGFYMGTDPDPINNGSEYTGLSYDFFGIFRVNPAGLTPGTTYYYAAFARNADGEVTGSIVSFDTVSPPPAPAVDTLDASGVTLDSATVEGLKTNGNDISAVLEQGFYFGTDPDPINNGSTFTPQFDIGGRITRTITSLSDSTTYYYAAYVITAEGEGRGAVKSFTSLSPYPVPAVETLDASGVGPEAGTIEGLKTNGNDIGPILEQGFYFGTDPDPVNNGSKVAPQFDIAGRITNTRQGLANNTTYYFVAYVITADGEGRGAVKSFTTTSPYPAPTVETLDPNIVDTTTVELAGLLTNGNDIGPVLEKGFYFGTDPDPINNGSKLPPQFTLSGQFTNTQSSLAPGTTYYVAAYVITAEGEARGSITAFTMPLPVTVTVLAAANGSTDKDGANVVPSGFPFTVTATADPGYIFETWTGDITSPDAVLTIPGVSADLSIQPVFTNQKGSLTVRIIDNPGIGYFSIHGPAEFNGGAPLENQTVDFSAAVPVGDYTVVFAEVAGSDLAVKATGFAIAGSTATGTLALAATEEIVGTYTGGGADGDVNTGSLKVNILPAGAASAGASWKVVGDDDDPYRLSGDIKTAVAAGQRTVTFTDVDGYDTPSDHVVNIETGAQTTLTVIYGRDGQEGGTITVIQGEGETPDGAAWRPASNSSADLAINPANGSPTFFAFGQVVSNVPAGELEIIFSDVPGYITPANTTITITSDEAIVVKADYIRPFVADLNDYDGDGRVDLTVYNAASGTWSTATIAGRNNGLRKSSSLFDATFGDENTVPAPGDYDGDGISDLAGFDRESGDWIVDGQFTLRGFGGYGDIPVPADYDGDGSTDPAVYSPFSGRWTMWLSRTDAMATLINGDRRYLPQPGDYNGDGYTDLGIYHQSKGTWKALYFRPESGTYRRNARKLGTLGIAGDIPVAGDYDGDGYTDIAVYRPSTGTFMLENGLEQKVGKPALIPVPADWNGDGITDPAVFMKDRGRWFISIIGDVFKTRFGKSDQPLNR